MKSNQIRFKVIDSLDAPYEFLSNEQFANTGYTIINDFDEKVLGSPKDDENTKSESKLKVR